VLTAGDDHGRDLEKIGDVIKRRFYLDSFERVIYTESHDEVANGKARMPEELAPGSAETFFAKKLSTLGAALVFTSAGIPMIFQGQELLEDDWFHDQDPVDWSRKERFAGIFRLYSDLISLRLNREGNTDGLCGQETDLYHLNNDDKVLAFHRWNRGGPGDSTVVAANFANREFRDYRIGLPAEGVWKVRFNSDSRMYDGEFSGIECDDPTAAAEGMDGQPFSGTVSLAPYGVIILSQQG
jgi:1,4-alpha-glucan branching enzyme